jgi:hypothetical protein
MTGTLRCPRPAIACSEGKIFLKAKFPLAPKKPKASKWVSFMGCPYFADFSRCPPNPKRIAESSLSWKSASPRDANRS